jgi:hypothetical protein
MATRLVIALMLQAAATTLRSALDKINCDDGDSAPDVDFDIYILSRYYR